jgi:hypothetical protein
MLFEYIRSRSGIYLYILYRASKEPTHKCKEKKSMRKPVRGFKGRKIRVIPEWGNGSSMMEK